MENSCGTCAASYANLHSFSDVKAMLCEVRSHKELCALVEAVDERFVADQQQLKMTDEDWIEWTSMVASKAATFESRDEV